LHIEAMDQVVATAVDACPNIAAAFQSSLEVLGACGVSWDQVQVTKNLVRELQAGAINTKEYRLRFRRLRSEEPHAYNLVQGIVELLREKQRIRVLAHLPHEFLQAQLRAIHQRFGTRPGEFLKDAVVFRFCPVCDTIYTLVREFGGSYVNSYGYGMRDALVEYSTDRIFCRRSKVNHRGKCGVEPLAELTLLGKVLFYCGRQLLLCPQPGCGMAMALDPKQCVWNEHGPCCYDCSYKQRVQKLQYGIDFDTRCALCNQPLKESDRIHLFPYGAALCRKDFKQYSFLIPHLQTPEVAVKLIDRASTKKIIVEYRAMRMRQKKAMMAPMHNRQTKLSRMNTRARKR
jgi:hypothetical protein